MAKAEAMPYSRWVASAPTIGRSAGEAALDPFDPSTWLRTGRLNPEKAMPYIR